MYVKGFKVQPIYFKKEVDGHKLCESGVKLDILLYNNVKSTTHALNEFKFQSRHILILARGNDFIA